MEPHWLKLRWPLTVLALGAMVMALLMRSSQHPIQLRLVLSFAEPLQLAGRVQGVLSMPNGVKIEPASSLHVRVTEQAPIDLSVNNTSPVKVTTAPDVFSPAAKTLLSAPRSNGSVWTERRISAPGHRREKGHFADAGKGGVEVGQFLIQRHPQ